MMLRLSYFRLSKGSESLTGSLLPTTMDPVTTVSILGAVLSCVQAIFDTIDKNRQLGAVEHEALTALRRTVGDVEDDIKFFKTMISTLESTGDEHTSLFLQGSANFSLSPMLGGVTNILSQA